VTPAPFGLTPATPFVVGLSPDLNQLAFRRFFTAAVLDCATGTCMLTTATFTSVSAITAGPSGSAIVAGYTTAADFPRTPGAYSNSGFCAAAIRVECMFVTKLSTDGTKLVWSSVISPSQPSIPVEFGISGVTLDTSGNVLVAGSGPIPPNYKRRNPDFDNPTRRRISCTTGCKRAAS